MEGWLLIGRLVEEGWTTMLPMGLCQFFQGQTPGDVIRWVACRIHISSALYLCQVLNLCEMSPNKELYRQDCVLSQHSTVVESDQIIIWWTGTMSSAGGVFASWAPVSAALNLRQGINKLPIPKHKGDMNLLLVIHSAQIGD